MSEKSIDTSVKVKKNGSSNKSSSIHSKNGFNTNSIYFKVKVPDLAFSSRLFGPNGFAVNSP